MSTKLVYNPTTKRMEMKEETTSSSSTWTKGDIDFIIGGELLKKLEGFAKEDKIDLSEKVLRARAIKGYVTAAIDEWAEKRTSLHKQAAKPDDPKRNDPPKPNDPSKPNQTPANANANASKPNTQTPAPAGAPK